MARPREFDETEVLDRALAAFWEHGYEGTSIDQLSEATGLGRASLYAAFGGKEGMFEKAIARYVERFGDLAAIDDAPSARAALERLLRALVLQASPKRGPGGCFLMCAAVGGDAPPAAREAYATHTARLERTIATIVRRGQESGEIARSADATSIARMLVLLVQGLSASARAGRPPSQLNAALDTALTLLT